LEKLNALEMELSLYKEESKNQRFQEKEEDSTKSKINTLVESIESISKALEQKNGEKALQYLLAKDYIDSLSKLAKKGNVVVMPANPLEPLSILGNTMAVLRSNKDEEKNISKEEALEKLAEKLQNNPHVNFYLIL
jgi:hypothetical protein